MKKASVLIIASVLLAALFCIAGCSSDVSYTDEKTGVTVSLPDSWEEQSYLEEDNNFLAFTHEGSQDGSSEIINCLLVAEVPYKSITDYSEEFITNLYSGFEVDNVEEKDLSSGTYYEVTGSSDDVYYVIYLTVENGYLIQFDYSSESAETPYLSTFENMVDNAEFGSSSSDESESSTDSGDKSTSKEYTDDEAGLTVTLPSNWKEEDIEDVSSGSNSNGELRMEFGYDDGKDSAFIYCTAFSGFDGASFSDYSKEDIAKLYSVSADDISKKKLSSGSYYLFERSKPDDSDDDSHAISYVTIKNDCLIDFMYASVNENDPCLSDFEDMVDSVKYK